jgi:HPt (histidine-containing phosphotransfer) domain-containing protein
MDRAIAAIWEKYRPLNRERLDSLEQVAAALHSGSIAPELRMLGEQNAHKIAGSAGSFGYDDISDIARELECQLASESPTLDPKQFHHQVARLRELLGF